MADIADLFIGTADKSDASSASEIDAMMKELEADSSGSNVSQSANNNSPSSSSPLANNNNSNNNNSPSLVGLPQQGQSVQLQSRIQHQNPKGSTIQQHPIQPLSQTQQTHHIQQVPSRQPQIPQPAPHPQQQPSHMLHVQQQPHQFPQAKSVQQITPQFSPSQLFIIQPSLVPYLAKVQIPSEERQILDKLISELSPNPLNFHHLSQMFKRPKHEGGLGETGVKILKDAINQRHIIYLDPGNKKVAISRAHYLPDPNSFNYTLQEKAKLVARRSNIAIGKNSLTFINLALQEYLRSLFDHLAVVSSHKRKTYEYQKDSSSLIITDQTNRAFLDTLRDDNTSPPLSSPSASTPPSVASTPGSTAPNTTPPTTSSPSTGIPIEKTPSPKPDTTTTPSAPRSNHPHLMSQYQQYRTLFAQGYQLNDTQWRTYLTLYFHFSPPTDITTDELLLCEKFLSGKPRISQVVERKRLGKRINNTSS